MFDTKTDWMPDRQSESDFDLDLDIDLDFDFDFDNCKRQIRPFVTEGAPRQQTLKYLTVIKICFWTPDGSDTKRDWPTDRRS
jgi:hypothetical protein